MERLLREAYGIAESRLEPLQGGQTNSLWRYGQWVVKVYNHQKVPRAQVERAVQLQAYAASRGLPVPAPHPNRAGALWTEGPDGLVVVMPYLAGIRRATGPLQPGQLNRIEAVNLGATLGRLHSALRDFPCLAAEPPPPYDLSQAAAQWAELRRQALAQPTRTPFDVTVITMADYVMAAARRFPGINWHEESWQTCHRDLHLKNLLFDQTGRVVGVLDFDNASPWWTGLEVMMVWHLSVCHDHRAPALTAEGKSFFDAYRGAVDLPARVWTTMPRIYWVALVCSTMPAPLRYSRQIEPKPHWADLLQIRLMAARWLEAHGGEMDHWLA